MARFCESCGSPLEEDAAFCEICGSKVEPDEAEGADIATPDPAPPIQIESPTPVEPPIEEPIEPVAPPIPEAVLEAPVEQAPSEPFAPEPVAQPEQPLSAVPSTTAELAQATPRSVPKLAIAAAAVLVIATGVFGGLQLLKGKPAKAQPPVAAEQERPAPQTPEPKAADKAINITELRTEVTKVLGDVSASRWSDAVCNQELPKLKSLIAKAKEGGRDDLGNYWTSLSLYMRACNAASKQDRASAKKYLTSAVTELAAISVDSIKADSVLQGDVIGTIGSFMSVANDMGLPADYPSCQTLTRLKKELEKQ